MNLLTKEFQISKVKISFAAILWFLLTIIGILLKIRLGHDKIGNYLVYENVFRNFTHHANIYYVDPASNLGSYLYGPLFSIIIAPFAFFPTNAGAFLWGLVNAGFLFWAIRKLPFSFKNQNIILLFSTLEMLTSIQNMQINCIIAGLIILSYVFVQKEKDFWATLFIAIGFLVKLYGIAGIAFFLFSKHKIKFAYSFVFWLVVLFCLPMVISSPSFIIQSYSDWYHTLVVKDNLNTFSEMQNVSVMGMLRHIFKCKDLEKIIIITAAFFYALPFVRVNQFKNIGYRLSYLALVLIGVVIFSSSAESPTYIIAVSGVGIWYIIQDKTQWWVVSLFVFTFVVTILSPTDLFPEFIRLNLIQPYSLKALPCFLVWIVLVYQLMKKDFSNLPHHYLDEARLVA